MPDESPDNKKPDAKKTEEDKKNESVKTSEDAQKYNEGLDKGGTDGTPRSPLDSIIDAYNRSKYNGKGKRIDPFQR